MDAQPPIPPKSQLRNLPRSSSPSPPTPTLQLDEPTPDLIVPEPVLEPEPEPEAEPSAIHFPELSSTEPLYTEIHIPLPPIPNPLSTPASPSLPHSKAHNRSRARSLSSLSPFRRRSQESPDGARSASPTKSLFSRPRTGTLDAVAVLPSVLMLSTEMFTPGKGREEIH